MVFYFSGTGNSLYVAKKVVEHFEQNLISIAECTYKNRFSFKLAKEEPIIFVFPIYSWAPPKIVLDFIDKLQFDNFENNQVSVLITCGENIGNSLELLVKHFGQNMTLNCGFSVIMPSNYMILGEIETKEVQTKVLKEVDPRLTEIFEVMKSKPHRHFDAAKGPVPFILTHVVGTLFNKFAVDPKPFFAKDNCTGCGICAHVCTTKNIVVEQTKVTWGSQCTQCLACINYCPVQAIEYGKKTLNKGRYNNPNIKVNEMFKEF